MASSLLALLDDIAALLDDVSLGAKAAAGKTAAVVGDDLALNARQVAGVRADRELPVVWAVAKGSLLNKAILVPAALAISAWMPWAVTPLLMLGGAFLCLEGFEKLAHRLLRGQAGDAAHRQKLIKIVADPHADLRAIEKEKIKGAVRTDFILSGEIIVITLGTVAQAEFPVRVMVLGAIAVAMTAGVYGLVAAIVKFDDFGLYLSRAATTVGRALGTAILRCAPWLMKGLSVAGAAAMFLVGGGILVHGLPFLHQAIELRAASAAGLGWAVSFLLGGLAGIVAGAIAWGALVLVRRAIRGRAAL